MSETNIAKLILADGQDHTAATPSPWSVNRTTSGEPQVPKNLPVSNTRFGDFLARVYPPIEYVMEPWLPTRGLAMVAGYRGIGKTFVGMSVAFAIATGGSLLNFRAPVPRTVLYVDGEMDPAELQERFRKIMGAAKSTRNGKPQLAKNNLHVLSHADRDLGIPDLADPTGIGRAYIEAVLAETNAEVLVLDNLSSLCRTGIENDAESWSVMQEWLLSLRRQGKTVLIIHHTGKPDENGNVSQRGTSKREDILNTSILLKASRPARSGEFVWQFTKSRGFASPEPFTAQLVVDTGYCALRRREGDLTAEIGDLLAKGVLQKEIAQSLGVSQAKVSRWKPKETISKRPKKLKTSVKKDAVAKAFNETGSETRESSLAALSAGEPSPGAGFASNFTEGGI